MPNTEDLVAEELEVVSAIYGEDWSVVDSHTFAYSLAPRPEGIDEEIIDTLALDNLTIRFSLLDDYPVASSPLYQFEGGRGWWDIVVREFSFPEPLEELCAANLGEATLFTFIEAIREYVNTSEGLKEHLAVKVDEKLRTESSQGQFGTATADALEHNLEELTLHTEGEYAYNKTWKDASGDQKDTDGRNAGEVPEITSHEPFTIKKSTFQAHVAAVHSVEDVRLVMGKLLESRKIQRATHNMYAYRIYNESKGVWLADCDDDGEQHAGSRLAHLLDMQGVKDVLVVVSRWFGGILLGPDRFKHINNVARVALVDQGYVRDKEK